MRAALRRAPAPRRRRVADRRRQGGQGPDGQDHGASSACPPTPQAIAAHYGGLIDGFVIDAADAAEAIGLGLPTLATPTLMATLDDKVALAREMLAFARRARRAVREDA